MNKTPVFNPCRWCGSPATAYLAPSGYGYQAMCSNAACLSRQARGSIVGHFTAIGVAHIWNDRQKNPL